MSDNSHLFIRRPRFAFCTRFPRLVGQPDKDLSTVKGRLVDDVIDDGAAAVADLRIAVAKAEHIIGRLRRKRQRFAGIHVGLGPPGRLCVCQCGIGEAGFLLRRVRGREIARRRQKEGEHGNPESCS